MADNRDDPDPADPRVREEIRGAIKRARNSAFGSYMGEQDLARAASANLANVYGSGAVDATFTAAIRHEMRRQALASAQERSSASPRMPDLLPPDFDDAPPLSRRARPCQPSDPLTALSTDHWFTDQEMYSVRHIAPYPQDLMRHRYDPGRESDFYRGCAVALAMLAKMIGPGDSVQRYRDIVWHVDAVMRTWPGTEDQAAGASFGLTNAYGFARSGNPVSALAVALRIEISCIAECFVLARQQGR